MITQPRRWESLKTQASERRGALEEAHERAKDFHDHWKELIDWLADAERRAYADWKPSALPETCQADITKHQVSPMSTVIAHTRERETICCVYKSSEINSNMTWSIGFDR